MLVIYRPYAGQFMPQHYLSNMRLGKLRKVCARSSAQIVNREVGHLLVISFQHELNRAAADAHMEAFTHRLIFVLRENEATVQDQWPVLSMVAFLELSVEVSVFTLPPGFVVFPWNGPNTLFKIEMRYFGLPQFADPACP